MDNGFVIEVTNQAIKVTMMLAAPMLIGALVVGILVSLFQAVTQINEQTLSFIPKIVVIVMALVILSPWMMETMTSFLTLMQAVPLKPALRRKNALKLFGYRDVVAAGDTRQLPPANGRRPWWSGSIFRNMFEIFVLRNDRRHERDLAMQTLKEKFAWGGIVSGP